MAHEINFISEINAESIITKYKNGDYSYEAARIRLGNLLYQTVINRHLSSFDILVSMGCPITYGNGRIIGEAIRFWGTKILDMLSKQRLVYYLNNRERVILILNIILNELTDSDRAHLITKIEKAIGDKLVKNLRSWGELKLEQRYINILNDPDSKLITGVRDLDIEIILYAKTLEDIIGLCEDSNKIKEILRDSTVFEKVKKIHHVTYISTIDELLTLKHELDKTRERWIEKDGDDIQDIAIGDRVVIIVSRNDVRHNYSIIDVTEREAKLREVDFLGKPVYDSNRKENNVKITLDKLNIKEDSKRINKWIWNRNTDRIKYGILLYNSGPMITKLDSIYLKYKTYAYPQYNIKPEINTLVSVNMSNKYPRQVNAYVITETNGSDFMKLEHIRGTLKNKVPSLTAYKLDKTQKTWKTDEIGYVDVTIGSWYSSKNYYTGVTPYDFGGAL